MQKNTIGCLALISLGRLIKASIVALALSTLFFYSTGDCQTRRLPKATFPSYAGSMPASPSIGAYGGSSGGSGGAYGSGSGMYGGASGGMYGSPSNIVSTPGVHLTSGMDRTNA